MAATSDDSGDHATAVQIGLGEFGALRGEISNRSSAQNTLINLNITAVGTIGGLSIAYHANPLVLLILPPLSSALGLLYIDHARNISRLGWYVRERLWTSLRQASSDTKIPTYEDEVASYERRALTRIGFGLPFFFMFWGPPIFGLAFTFSSLGDVWTIVLWVVGLLMLCDLVISWSAFIIRPFARRKGAKNTIP